MHLLRAMTPFRGLLFLSCTLVLAVAPGRADAETFSVRRDFRPGSSWESPRLDNAPVESVQVVVRRLDPRRRNTTLSVQFDDGLAFENGRRMQVDREFNHTLSWDGHDADPRGRRLVVNVNDGPVFIEEVTVNQRPRFGRDHGSYYDHDRCHGDRRCGDGGPRYDDDRYHGDHRCDGDRRDDDRYRDR